LGGAIVDTLGGFQPFVAWLSSPACSGSGIDTRQFDRATVNHSLVVSAGGAKVGVPHLG